MPFEGAFLMVKEQLRYPKKMAETYGMEAVCGIVNGVRTLETFSKFLYLS